MYVTQGRHGSFPFGATFHLLTVILTHWGRVTHICVSNLAIIGSDNGLSPGRRQAIIWPNAGILLIRTSVLEKRVDWMLFLKLFNCIYVYKEVHVYKALFQYKGCLTRYMDNIIGIPTPVKRQLTLRRHRVMWNSVDCLFCAHTTSKQTREIIEILPLKYHAVSVIWMSPTISVNTPHKGSLIRSLFVFSA